MTILENIMQNLYKNIDPKASKDLKNAELPMKAIKAATASQLLESLIPGESSIVKGKVLDLRQDQILLQLLSGEKLSARTETSLPLSIGDVAEFIVAGKEGKLITLKLAGGESNEDTQTQKTVSKALEAAGITPTERSEGTVKELMLHSQPINEGNIKKFLALSAKYPDVPIKELVLMDIAKIPLTKENLEIYRDFGNSEPVAEFAAAVTEVSESIEALPDGLQKEALQSELKGLITEMLSANPENPEGSAVRSDDALNVPEQTVNNSGQLVSTAASEGSAAENTIGAAKEGQKTDADLLKSAESAEKATSEEINKSAFNSAGSEVPGTDRPISESRSRQTANELHSALHLPPKDFGDPKKVKTLYEKLESVSEKLKKLEERVAAETAESVKEAAARSQPQTHAARLSSTLKFMDSINNVFPYVQLPIKLKEENARGDLYVYEKKRAFKAGDTVSALLHLDLDNLGETDILIKLTGMNAVVTISAATEDSKEVFSSEIPALTEALGKKGYSLNCDVNVSEEKEEKVPLLTQFLESHSPSLVSRFSFDMRA
ncbi:MAG: flagellar hook-length control protein FliK [Lachnospiraceae bacterium]|nr:flagellar hook-length control protein FliK [Lachnospiraceae bacterium]